MKSQKKSTIKLLVGFYSAEEKRRENFVKEKKRLCWRFWITRE